MAAGTGEERGGYGVKVIGWLVEALGFAVLVGAGWLLYPVLGLFLLGVILVLYGNARLR